MDRWKAAVDLPVDVHAMHKKNKECAGPVSWLSIAVAALMSHLNRATVGINSMKVETELATRVSRFHKGNNHKPTS